MIIKCWGARGSIPVSGNGYNKYGGDTTCVEIRSKNDDIVIIDAGTGIRRLGSQLLKEKMRNINILLTHAHWDHVQGFPFFKPIYLQEMHIKIFGCPFLKNSVQEMLEPMLTQPFFPVSFKDIKAKIEYFPIGGESFSIGSLSITPILLNHPNQGLGYKFTEDGRSFVFLTDNELNFKHPDGLGFEDYAAFCSQAELLFHDAGYTEEDYQQERGWGHSVYKDVLQLGIKAGVKKIGFFHHHHERTDQGLDKILSDCRHFLKKQKLDLDCFAVRQDMEITLNKDHPFLIKNDPAGQEDITALEEKVQKLQIEKEEALQQAAAEANDELSQLKSTILALRDELGKMQAEKEKSIQQTKSLLNNEMNQLKETISAQRETMTGHQITFEENLQKTKQSLKNESTQLQQTISVLREKLEGSNGK